MEVTYYIPLSRILFNLSATASSLQTLQILPDILTREIEVNQSLKIFKRRGTIKITISAWDGPGTPKVAFELVINIESPTIKLFKFIFLRILIP